MLEMTIHNPLSRPINNDILRFLMVTINRRLGSAGFVDQYCGFSSMLSSYMMAEGCKSKCFSEQGRPYMAFYDLTSEVYPVFVHISR